MTIGGASHRALVRILMHARSTEPHAYASANYTRGTGSLVEERAASAIASSSSKQLPWHFSGKRRGAGGSVNDTAQMGQRVEGHENLRTPSATA